MRRRNEILLAAALLALLGLAGGCGGSDDPGPTAPGGPSTAAEYTERGWERYEAGDYEGAANDFATAIDRDVGYGEAHAGAGWTQLAVAVSTAGMQQAAAHFVAAITQGEGGVYVQAGRAAASLGTGGSALAAAVTQAGIALEAESDFAFEHRGSFDWRDLRLIQAFALAAQGHFDNALAAADAIADSGIDEADSGSWQIGDTVYPNYLGAVLAHLHRMSDQYAG